MLGSELGENSDNLSSAVLGKGPWDGLKGISSGSVRRLLESFDVLGFLVKSVSELELGGSTTWKKSWVGEDVSGNSEGVVKVSLHLVERVLGASSK